MLNKKIDTSREKVEMLCLDSLVPENHLLRDIERTIDFSFIYELIEDLYCGDNGRPSIDPVVLIKMQLIQYMYGISSMRQTAKEIEVNLAYKWFLGYGISEKTPHFSVISKNYYRRFKDSKIYEEIFQKILKEAIRNKYVKTDSIFIDGTHIKASANKRKSVDEYIYEEAKFYTEELRKEIESDRENHGKKELGEIEVKKKKVQRSTTDPECGMFHKGEKERCFAYNANTACDRNGFVLDVEVTAGNRNDSSSFKGIYDKVNDKYKETIKNIVLDSGYRVPAICREVIENDQTILLPYKAPMTKKGYFKKHEYVYDEYYDEYICPNEKILHYSNTNKEGYREYRSKKCDCKNCPTKGTCTGSDVKIIQRHIWEDYIEIAEDMRHTEGNKQIYSKRKETIERVFADAKEKHGMRYTRVRGLMRVTNEVKLIFSCMNLKKLARWKRNNGHFNHLNSSLIIFIKSFINYRKKVLIFG